MTKRIKKIAKLVQQFLELSHGCYDFEMQEGTKECSGLSIQEKNLLYDILVNFGVPVQQSDESKDDWELLRLMMVKQLSGEEVELLTSEDTVKSIEKFVN